MANQRIMAAIGLDLPLVTLGLFFVLNLSVITLAFIAADAPHHAKATGSVIGRACSPCRLQLGCHVVVLEADSCAAGAPVTLSSLSLRSAHGRSRSRNRGNARHCRKRVPSMARRSSVSSPQAPEEIDFMVRAVDVRCGVAIASSLLMVVVHLV